MDKIGSKKTMQDKTIAYLSGSKNYYIRKEPNLKNWKTIKYYSLDGLRILLAKGVCAKCKDVMESQYCGHFVSCKCMKSFVDTDRWFPEHHRYSGDIVSK